LRRERTETTVRGSLYSDTLSKFKAFALTPSEETVNKIFNFLWFNLIRAQTHDLLPVLLRPSR
jgi:hypothetical protein